MTRSGQIAWYPHSRRARSAKRPPCAQHCDQDAQQDCPTALKARSGRQRQSRRPSAESPVHFQNLEKRPHRAEPGIALPTGGRYRRSATSGSYSFHPQFFRRDLVFVGVIDRLHPGWQSPAGSCRSPAPTSVGEFAVGKAGVTFGKRSPGSLLRSTQAAVSIGAISARPDMILLPVGALAPGTLDALDRRLRETRR